MTDFVNTVAEALDDLLDGERVFGAGFVGEKIRLLAKAKPVAPIGCTTFADELEDSIFEDVELTFEKTFR